MILVDYYTIFSSELENIPFLRSFIMRPYINSQIKINRNDFLYLIDQMCYFNSLLYGGEKFKKGTAGEKRKKRKPKTTVRGTQNAYAQIHKNN